MKKSCPCLKVCPVGGIPCYIFTKKGKWCKPVKELCPYWINKEKEKSDVPDGSSNTLNGVCDLHTDEDVSP